MPPLGALPTAPSDARAYARGALVAWRMETLCDAVELAVSELTTNAVNASTRDNGTPSFVEGRLPMISLRLFTDGKRLIVEVWDQAPGIPVRTKAGHDAESGRGLDLIDALTGSRWGWRPARSGPGKCVWAEFSVPSRP
jgi:anti-sigma regulatory factor (Ser/Thr protein kinase)